MAQRMQAFRFNDWYLTNGSALRRAEAIVAYQNGGRSMNGGDQRVGGREVLRSMMSAGGRHPYQPGEMGAGEMGSGRERATAKHSGTGWSVSLELTVKRDGTSARIRTQGYINREGGIQISNLAQRLAITSNVSSLQRRWLRFWRVTGVDAPPANLDCNTASIVVE